MRTAARVALAFSSMLMAGNLFAQSEAIDVDEAPTSCKDGAGVMHVGDGMSACKEGDFHYRNMHGRLVRIVEGSARRAKRLEQAASAALAQRERDEQRRRDRSLVDMYLTVSDIERHRDQQKNVLKSQLEFSAQQIASLQNRLAQLRELSTRFRPYSDQQNALPLPQNIAAEIINAVNGLATAQQAAELKKQEEATLSAKFSEDISRFKELKPLQ